jgi:hypothetical protein
MPLLNWTALDPTQPVAASTPTMYQSSGIMHVKGFVHHIKGLDTKFRMKDDLRAFQCSVKMTYMPSNVVSRNISVGPAFSSHDYASS